MPGRLRVVPAETALAHSGLIGQDRKRKFVGQMAVDPVMKRSEFILCRLQRRGGAELRLSSGTLEKNHQVAGYRERHGTAKVFFHERQRQIDPGRDSCGGPNWTITHENRIGLDTHGGKAAGKPGAVHPVGGCAAPVQHPCRSEQECSSADGGDATRLRRPLPHPVDQYRVLSRRLGPSPPATSKVSSASPGGVSGPAASATPAEAVTPSPPCARTLSA